MNIIDMQDNLKDLPDQALMSEMERPSGSAPPFLIVGELRRRKRMRDDYQRRQNENSPTVAQEAMTAVGVPQGGLPQMAKAMAPKSSIAQNTGINQAMPVTPTQAPQPQAPQMMSDGGIMQLRDGGKVVNFRGQDFAVFDDGEVYRVFDNGVRRKEPSPSVARFIQEMAANQVVASDTENEPEVSSDSPITLGSEAMMAADAAVNRGSSITDVDSIIPPSRLPRQISTSPSPTFDFDATTDAPRAQQDAKNQDAYIRSRIFGPQEIAEEERMRGSQIVGGLPTSIDEMLKTQQGVDARAMERDALNAAGIQSLDSRIVDDEMQARYADTRNMDQRFTDSGYADKVPGRQPSFEDQLANAKALMEAEARSSNTPVDDDVLPSDTTDGGREDYDNKYTKSYDDFFQYQPDTGFQQTSSQGINPPIKGIADSAQGVYNLDRYLASQKMPDGQPGGTTIEARKKEIANTRIRNMLDAQKAEEQKAIFADSLDSRIADDEMMAVMAAKEEQNEQIARSYDDSFRMGELAYQRPELLFSSDQSSGGTLPIDDKITPNETDADSSVSENVAQSSQSTLGIPSIVTQADAVGAPQVELSESVVEQNNVIAPKEPRESDLLTIGEGMGALTNTQPKPSGGGTASGTGGGLRSRIEQMISDRESDRESNKWMALAQTGMALMASKNPTLGGALGEAGLAGVGALQKSKSQYDKDMLGLLGMQEDMRKADLTYQASMARTNQASKGGSKALNQAIDDARAYLISLETKARSYRKVNAPDLITGAAASLTDLTPDYVKGQIVQAQDRLNALERLRSGGGTQFDATKN